MWSQRTFHDPTPNALHRALEARQAAGLPVVDLTSSNPTVLELGYPVEQLRAALSLPGVEQYQPHALGLPSAREAAANHLRSRGVPANAQHTMLTASTSEAYAFLFKALCNPGDNVLVPTPSYPLLQHLAVLEGVALRTYPLRFDGAWHVDVAALRAAVTSETRAVVVVSPNNPTGHRLTARDLDALAALGLPLLSDEVFALYPLDPAPDAVATAAIRPYVLTAVMGGLSKDLGLPQLKLAWTSLHGPPALVESLRARLELVADTFLSVGTPVQLALPALLEHGAVVRANIHARLRENLAHARRACGGSAVTALPVEGGWTLMLRVPAVMEDEAWALHLLQEEGVLVQPGYFYDVTHATMLVVSLLVPPPRFQAGLAAILRCVLNHAPV